MRGSPATAFGFFFNDVLEIKFIECTIYVWFVFGVALNDDRGTAATRVTLARLLALFTTRDSARGLWGLCRRASVEHFVLVEDQWLMEVSETGRISSPAVI